jgi:hypothetical protein
MPFTDNGMREWVERLMALGAVYVDDNGYYARNTTSFDELTPAEIMAVASEYGAGYILVDFNEDKVAEFEALGAEVFDSQGRWTVLEVEQ